MAKRSDIVLPCTTTLERNDICLSQKDPYIIRMERAVDPVGQARDDYEIFCNISRRLGFASQFSEDRSADDWIRLLYEQTSHSDGKMGDLASTETTSQHAAAPMQGMLNWEEFCEKGWYKLKTTDKPRVMLEKFVSNPEANPLATPSGKIEIFSTTIDSFEYEDCAGHPIWLEPYEWLGNAVEHELHLISNQPSTKLHSQLDQGSVSRAGKIADREPVLVNPVDAKRRGIDDGDAIKLHNKRGACLGIAKLSENIRTGVIQMSTGAWWDPDDTGLCRHGNPNALTRDKGTSKLAQGPSAHTCLVKIERYDGELPRMEAYDPPEILKSAE